MDSDSYTEWSLKNALLKVKLISFQEFAKAFLGTCLNCVLFFCALTLFPSGILICDETRVGWMSSVFV